MDATTLERLKHMVQKKPFVSDAVELEILAILRTLKQVVMEAGDSFVYQTDHLGKCYYVRNGEPSCIAGRVLHRLGVSTDVLKQWEGEGVDHLSLDSCTCGNNRPTVPFSNEALIVLRRAQTRQDASANWGDCRDAALLFAYQKYGVTAA